MISPRSHPAGAGNQAVELRREGVTVTTDAMGQLMVSFGQYGWFPAMLPSEAAEGREASDEEEEGD